jgi:hypothetical protein
MLTAMIFVGAFFFDRSARSALIIDHEHCIWATKLSGQGSRPTRPTDDATFFVNL